MEAADFYSRLFLFAMDINILPRIRGFYYGFFDDYY